MDAIRQQLAADHRVIDDLFCRLLHDVVSQAHHDLQVTWCELEHRLLSHMDVEEQLLLPLVHTSHPTLLERNRREHALIRRLVEALGTAVGLQTLREPQVLELQRLLHEHSEREDQALYQTACGDAPVAVQYRMATALRTAARMAHAAAVRTRVNRSRG